MKKIYFLLPLLVFTLLFTSCNKDDDPEPPTKAKVIVSTTVEDYGAIANVSVTLWNDTTDVAIATKTTDTDGKVVFDNVTPGSLAIEAEYENADGDIYDGDAEFSVVAGDEKNVSVLLEF